jgi:tetratricopeptide (TPR) repeat protein
VLNLPKPDALDSNLRFGILALQMEFVTSEQLLRACSSLSAQRDKSLGELLVGQGWLSEQDKAAIERRLVVTTPDGTASQAETLDAPTKRHLVSTQDPTVTTLTTNAQNRPLFGAARYAVTGLHARGGMGQVWIARDQTLHRNIAFKDLLPERRDDPSSTLRFMREAMITGQLEHPGIAPVYELGLKPASGEPFYAMRLVRGRTLAAAIQQFHEACDESSRGERPSEPRPSVPSRGDFSNMTFRHLLQAFVGVCQTVAFAHSRGVIHRDLKPANVVLGDFGEVIVLDWGLARLRGVADDDPRGIEIPRHCDDLSQAGQAVGTPAYMAPEQAEGRVENQDERTDVYGLGAVLYSILTGDSPFAGSASDLLVQVSRDAPKKPREVVKRAPRPLEAICLKAMAKRSADRFATAKLLADDVERWLADEPVGAVREPLGAHARRWARKHPGPVAAMVAALLVGLVGLGINSTMIARKNQELDLARRAEADRAAGERQAKQEALVAAAAEKAAKEAAQARSAETEEVLDFVQNRVLAAARPAGYAQGLGRDVTVRRALEAALPFVKEKFGDEPLIEARLRLTLANTFSYLGDATIAADEYQAARELYTKHRGSDDLDALRCLMGLATCSYNLGRHAEALALREETLALMKARLGEDHRETLMSMSNLASSYAAFGRRAEALELFEEALVRTKRKLGPSHPDTLLCMNNLAKSYFDSGRRDEALRLNEETLALERSSLGPQHPFTLMTMNNLADTLAMLGRQADALPLREEALASRKTVLGPDHPDTLTSMHNLGVSYCMLGRYADAMGVCEETLARMRAKRGPDHPDTLAAMFNLAIVYDALDRPSDALKIRQECYAATSRRLGPDHPQTLVNMGRLMDNLVRLNRSAEAVPLIDEFIERAAGKDIDPRLVPHAFELRLRHFEGIKDAAGCQKTAEMWEKLERRDAGSLYNAACMRAVAAAVIAAGDDSAELAAQADAEADLALKWLAQAVAAGFSDTGQLAADRDLDAIRDRDEFKKMLVELERTTPPSDKQPN